MRSAIIEQHNTDEQGRPAGGTTVGRGFAIEWQNGPLAVDGVRREPNGAFVEDVIAAVVGRLKHYQSTQFACHWNEQAIVALESALSYLDARTKERTERGVEGTHVV